jgi:hypothetical protein
MTPDIVVRPYDRDLKSRLMIYPGTICHLAEARLGKQIYRTGAFLPNGPLRCATAVELAALGEATGGGGRNRIIGVVRLTRGLIEGLMAAKQGDGRISTDRMQTSPFSQLASELAPQWVVRGPLLPLGYASYPAGFHTVTFDGAALRFIGLHIDDLDELPINRREESTNRLCINLGRHSRYLLFVRSMAQLLADNTSGGTYMNMRSTPLIHTFLNKFTEYPVARLEIRAGEGYIAPTENIIHDGSTFGMAGTDHQLTARGMIEPVSAVLP